MTSFIDYSLMIIGIFVVLIASIMIFLDKLKGEDVYLNIDVKEQELKKVMEDADEIISEINYISDVVVQEIEDKVKRMQDISQSIQQMNISTNGYISTTIPVQSPSQPVDPRIVYHNNMIYEAPFPTREPEIFNTSNPYPTQSQPKSNTQVKEKENKSQSKQKRVFDYAAQGMSVAEIAKKMSMGQGEVMLILSIKNEV